MTTNPHTFYCPPIVDAAAQRDAAAKRTAAGEWTRFHSHGEGQCNNENVDLPQLENFEKTKDGGLPFTTLHCWQTNRPSKA